MNYRHAFHAGNFADVLKHAILALALRRLAVKDAPFFYLDTEAGAARYALAGAEAARTGEAHDGILRLLGGGDPHPGLRPYLEVVRTLNAGEAGCVRYPGSPWIAPDGKTASTKSANGVPPRGAARAIPEYST